MEAVGTLVEQELVIPVLVDRGEMAPPPNLPLETVSISDAKLSQQCAQQLFENRKHKGLSREAADQAIRDPLLFSALLVKTGFVDGAVAGSIATTTRTAARRTATHATRHCRRVCPHEADHAQNHTLVLPGDDRVRRATTRGGGRRLLFRSQLDHRRCPNLDDGMEFRVKSRGDSFSRHGSRQRIGLFGQYPLG